MNPYHVDSLLQLSDTELCTALSVLFILCLTSGTCRLDYHRPENRRFFLALYKHMFFLEKRGCPRTVLEFCKLILSLDPENDPLGMLLLIDFLSLRAREYTFLSRMFQEWEAHQNLSQLPNFAFSVSLALYQHSQQDDFSAEEEKNAHEKACNLIQQALIMFPGELTVVVVVDGTAQRPSALTLLITLNVGRCCNLWKEPMVMSWLEQNVRAVLRLVDNKETIVQECEMRRKARYQCAPMNIHRHVILSEIKGVSSVLPLEEDLQEGDEAGAARDLNQGVNRPMAAMRDMLANLLFQEPPREDNPDEEADAEWD
ncbi:hypothetical protein XELAEV_18024894mg [Xenopus laevis]|uniref:Uncharacterized protein n=1 Tax=Xenopus laevis TaxID=8355 RepID=A0A974HLC1_XENLA|nr:hypothetical protein XELAEV_18024894mg [Xenopus laevis]